MIRAPIRALLLAALAPIAARAQLAIFVVLSGPSEIPAGTSYDFGRVAQGDTKDVRFRLRNTGTGALEIALVSVTGPGFRVTNRPSLPFPIATGAFQDITVRFEAAAPALYNATLQVNTTRLALLATSVPGASLSITSGCAFSGLAAIEFGRIPLGQTKTCGFSVGNPAPLPLTISTFRVTGAGFQGVSDVLLPLTIPAGGAASFSITFIPPAMGAFAGALTLETRTYSLSATVFEPALPTPILEFDRPAPQSAQQVRLTMRLPSPATTAASGLVNLSLTPDNPLIASDPAIVFLATGARSVPFSIAAGQTQALLAGQPSATFQTGTTAGRIQFTVTGVSQGIAGDATTTISIAPALVGVETATGVRRPGALDVQIVGFDNTYAAGPMTFAFYDRSGRPIPGGSLRADFSTDFRAFFLRSPAGSAFRLLLSFPVTGDAAAVGSVDVELFNAAGRTVIERVGFP